MKRVLILLTLACFGGTSTYAYISGKGQTEVRLIYCPERVTCAKQGDLSSCTFGSETPEFWGVIKLEHGVLPSEISAGASYKIATVDSGYHSKKFVETNCTYTRAGGGKAVLHLITKAESRLDGFPAPNWFMNTNPYGAMQEGQAHCYTTKDSKVCPLISVSGFGIIYQRNSINNGIKFSIDSKFLDSQQVIQERGYSFIPFVNISDCWSYKICKIDVHVPNWNGVLVKAGSVEVDMDNNMKVQQVFSNTPLGFNLKVDELLNSIEVEKMDGVPALLSVVDRVNLNLTLTVNDRIISKISKNNTARFDYDMLKKVCSNTKECLIGVANDSNGLIGSFSINAENNMTVVTTSSAHATEISVNKANDHTVEIKYPY